MSMNQEPSRADYMGMNGFVWWQGVVEDIFDPYMLGRVRVRILGFHTENKTNIPTKDLPWAHIVMPVNNTSVSGKGWSPTGLVPGTWVIGFFRDGTNSQQPVVIGSIGGLNPAKLIGRSEFDTIRQEELDSLIKKTKNDVGIKPYELPLNPTVDPTKGFADSAQIYPLISRMEEPDTNRLARNEQIENTIVKKKKDSCVTGAATALYGFWSEPETPYNAEYPFNHVYESQAGHITEYDDTPGAERTHHYHCSGTFTEVHPRGSEVHKVVANAWDITMNDKMILVKGNCSFNTGKTMKILMGKDLEIEVFGDAKMKVDGNMTVDVGGNYLQKVKGTYTLSSDGNMVIVAPRIDLNPEGESSSSIETAIGGMRDFVNGIIAKLKG